MAGAGKDANASQLYVTLAADLDVRIYTVTAQSCWLRKVSPVNLCGVQRCVTAGLKAIHVSLAARAESRCCSAPVRVLAH